MIKVLLGKILYLLLDTTRSGGYSYSEHIIIYIIHKFKFLISLIKGLNLNFQSLS
jgi:hypothetical protein